MLISFRLFLRVSVPLRLIIAQNKQPQRHSDKEIRTQDRKQSAPATTPRAQRLTGSGIPTFAKSEET